MGDPLHTPDADEQMSQEDRRALIREFERLADEHRRASALYQDASSRLLQERHRVDELEALLNDPLTSEAVRLDCRAEVDAIRARVFHIIASVLPPPTTDP